MHNLIKVVCAYNQRAIDDRVIRRPREVWPWRNDVNIHDTMSLFRSTLRSENENSPKFSGAPHAI